MANMVDAYENKQLDGTTGISQYTSPATTYVALFTADPTDTGSVTNELTSGGYARTSLSGKFSAATGTDGSVANTTLIQFPAATEDWTTVTHAGIMESDVETTDDMMMVITLNESISILDTHTFDFAIGDLVITAA